MIQRLYRVLSLIKRIQIKLKQHLLRCQQKNIHILFYMTEWQIT